MKNVNSFRRYLRKTQKTKRGHVPGPIYIAARDNKDKICLRLAKGSVAKIFAVLSFFKAKFLQLGRRIN